MEWKREWNSQPITWSITFDLNLEKSNEEPLAAENKLANKLFLKSELSDVKIFCEDKIFDCHKTILCCQSEVFKGIIVSVQGVKSLGGHFACLCRGFDFYEDFFCFFDIIFKKEKGNTFTL